MAKIPKFPDKHEQCKLCYFKGNDQNPSIFNECTLYLFNTRAVKSNNFKPLPTARKRA